MKAKDTEVEEFFAELADVRRIRQSNVYVAPDTQQKLSKKQQLASFQREELARSHPLSLDGIDPIDPHEFLLFQQPGVQDAVFKNLRMGKYPIEFKISLKGLSVQDSAVKLYQEINQCHERGLRTLLIEHGKGLESKPFPAFKKSCVKRWLDELSVVIAYHSAQPQHGGSGATYVMLKKHPLQKQINRESNRKR